MKIYHYAIIFVIAALALYVVAEIKTNQFTEISEEVEQLDEILQKAVDDGISQLVELEGIDQLIINKEGFVEHFYMSMYAGLTITDNPNQQERFNLYIPVILIVGEDGYYLQYSDYYQGKDGYTYLSKRWTEKKPYYYEDEDFVYRFQLNDIVTIYDKTGLLDESKEQYIFTLDYHELSSSIYENFRKKRPNSFLLNEEDFTLLRREQIIKSIEASMKITINHHNMIARERGISYQFSLPTVDQSEWVRSVETPGVIVMFQGYPLKDELYTYNNMVMAGAKVNKKDVYYLEQKDWYYIYHHKDCKELEKGGIYFMDKPYPSVYDCVKEGAYACEICAKGRGVYAPK